MIVIDKDLKQAVNLKNYDYIVVAPITAKASGHVVSACKGVEMIALTVATGSGTAEDRWLDIAQSWAVGQAIYFTDQPLVSDDPGHTTKELKESLTMIENIALGYGEYKQNDWYNAFFMIETALGLKGENDG